VQAGFALPSGQGPEAGGRFSIVPGCAVRTALFAGAKLHVFSAAHAAVGPSSGLCARRVSSSSTKP